MTTLPTVHPRFQKTPTNMIQTNQVDSLALIVTKIAIRQFFIQNQDQERHFKHYRSSKRHTKFQRPLYFRNCNSAGWFWQFKNTANKQDSARLSRPNTMISIRNYFWFQEPLEKYTITILPGALTDFFDMSNDTLSYKLTTKSTADYGNTRATKRKILPRYNWIDK
jgi:hypothetical protein